MENIGLDMFQQKFLSIALDDLPKDLVEIPNRFLEKPTDPPTGSRKELWDALAKINRSEVTGVWWSEVRRA